MIAELLKIGHENAISAAALCRLTGIPSAADLQKIIHRERLHGKPICATSTAPAGYFLAKDDSDLLNFSKSLKHREKEIAKVRRAIEKLAKGEIK